MHIKGVLPRNFSSFRFNSDLLTGGGYFCKPKRNKHFESGRRFASSTKKKLLTNLLTKKEKFRIVITVDSLTDGSRVEKVPSLSDLIGCGKKRKAIWNKLIPRTNPFLAHNKRYFCATSFFNRQNLESKKSHEILFIGIHLRTTYLSVRKPNFESQFQIECDAKKATKQIVNLYWLE